MLDLCIPTYNEAEIIEESIRIVTGALQKMSLEFSVIVADNGSTDSTESIVQALEIPHVRTLSIPQRGKGAGIIAAAKISRADMFGFIDADLSADPQEIMNFIHPLTDGSADIVIGSRLIDTSLVQRNFFRSLSSSLFNLVRHLILGINVVDSQCGLKVMNARGRELLAQCTETGWFIDLEFLRRAELAGLTVKELPVHWNEYRFPHRKPKLRMMSDGWRVLPAMFRIRRLLK